MNPKVQIILISLVLLCIYSGNMYAQVTVEDTLSEVNSLRNSYSYDKAYQLIHPYFEDHAEDLFAGWLYGQVLFDVGKYRESEGIYQKMISLYPEEEDLLIDYGLKLVDMGYPSKAVPILRNYLEKYPDGQMIRTSLAKALIWLGKFESAATEVDKVLAANPADPDARKLRKELKLIRSTRAELGVSYTQDDQPLGRLAPDAGASFFLNDHADLVIGAETPFLEADSLWRNSQTVSLGADLRFNRLTTRINVRGGVARLPDDSYSAVADISLDQKLYKHLHLNLNSGHRPYLYTVASVFERTMVWNYGGSLSWTDEKGWLAEAGILANQFYEDDNTQYSFSGWLMSPPLEFSVIGIRIGYGYNFSNTDKDRFESQLSLEEIENIWVDSTTMIPGIYNPYFSPRQQQVHSLVSTIDIEFSSHFRFGINANIGLDATIMQPYLYLDSDPDDEVFIKKDFYEERYTHIQLQTSADIQLSPRARIKAEYIYNQSIFYTSHSCGLRLFMYL